MALKRRWAIRFGPSTLQGAPYGGRFLLDDGEIGQQRAVSLRPPLFQVSEPCEIDTVRMGEPRLTEARLLPRPSNDAGGAQLLQLQIRQRRGVRVGFHGRREF